MIGVIGFAVLGIGAAIFLAGMPRVRKPGIDPELFEKATDAGARLTCAACGSAPILMLSVAYAGFFPLGALLTFVVIPAYGIIVFLSMLLPDVGRRAVTGFAAGIVAVLAYDLMRLALSYSQGGGDPIPHIGTMIMGHDCPWWVGYAWRTLGNGAGMGVIFTMLCPRRWWGPKLGLGYASCIGLGMLAFLSLFPQAQDQLFPVTWQTMVNSSLGHATYGLVLGTMARKAQRRRDRRTVTSGRHATGVSRSAGTGAGPPPQEDLEEFQAPSEHYRYPDPATRPAVRSSGTSAYLRNPRKSPAWADPHSEPVARSGPARSQEDVPTELLPVVPSVPPPLSGPRHARGPRSR